MEDQKRRQVHYHEQVHYRTAAPRIVDNSNAGIAWLNEYRLRKALTMMRCQLSGKTILSLCGGDGQEADFLHKHGASVTVIDLSTVALSAAQVRNPKLRCIAMDTEELAFADGAFDWVLVRDGLHHLARPLKGLYEAERVCREGFVILEGQDSMMVRLLSAIGVAENWDPAGGYVYRFSRRELQKVFSAMQTVSEWELHTAWLPFGSDILALFPAFRRFVYPVIRHPSVDRFLTAPPVKSVLKGSFNLLTAVGGRWGNSLIVVARKKLT